MLYPIELRARFKVRMQGAAASSLSQKYDAGTPALSAYCQQSDGLSGKVHR